MNTFTFVWQWFLMDLSVYFLSLLLVVHIVRKEPHPVSRLLEFAAFVLLNAAVFENFATLMGWYMYGRSAIMIFNVPLSVPLMEYLVVYCGLRFAESMKIPLWSRPLFVGVMGALTDFSLDPLAVSQRFATREGTIGRWTWFPAVSDLQVFGIPVYNFTGWILLCGFAALFLTIGRRILDRHPEKKWLEWVYPPVAMLLALGLLMTPVSNFLLWGEPFFAKGDFSEAVLLGLFVLGFAALLIFGWKGKMRRPLLRKEDWILPWIFTLFHALHLLFALVGGYWAILPLTLPVSLLHVGLVWFLWAKGAKAGKSPTVFPEGDAQAFTPGRFRDTMKKGRGDKAC